MANVLAMAKIQSIQQLHALGWSQRRIARALGVDRGAVAKYIQSRPPEAKPATAPLGSEGPKPATSEAPTAPAFVGTESAAAHDDYGEAKPAAAPTGKSDVASPAVAAICPSEPGPALARDQGRTSPCAAFHDVILHMLQARLSIQRIWQDLRAEHGLTASYYCVRRYVKRLRGKTPLPVRRMECAPGQEAQVDFGVGAPVLSADGKRRKTWVFRVILSHSRKGYSEATFTQTTEDFFRCLENAFHALGGVPRTLVIDNLKAAVAHPDWFDPVLTPKVQSFCQHYNTVILPTKPRTPEHKGKVERGVGYVKGNALRARTFRSLEEQNQFLATWEAHVADTRIHGTTKRHVGRLFLESEQAALQKLPGERFANFHEAQRKVHRDGHVEVAKAYYSVPPEYLGSLVWARWDARVVRIFNQRFAPIAIHVRREPGRFNTLGEHLHPRKINSLERGAGYLLRKTEGLGQKTHEWANAMLIARGIEGTRVLQGLLALGQRYPGETLEQACETALSYGVFHLRTPSFWNWRCKTNC